MQEEHLTSDADWYSGFGVNLRRIDDLEDEDVFGLFATLEAEPVNSDKQVQIAFVRGLVIDLSSYASAYAAETGENLYEGDTFRPLFTTDGFNEILAEELNECEGSFHFIYVEEVYVHGQIASSNLGALMVHATAHFLMEFTARQMAVLSVLGPYDDELTGRSKAIERYFRQFGFRQINDSIAHYLPPSAVLSDAEERLGDFVVRERGRIERLSDEVKRRKEAWEKQQKQRKA